MLPRLGDLDAADFRLEEGSPCLPGNNVCGVLMGAFGEGCGPTGLPVEAIPTALFLDQNRPNPFNPMTEIGFGLPAAERVSLRVYDPRGRLVRELLVEQRLQAGAHSITWRGDDDAGRPLASGVYFYRLEAGDQRLNRKMTLLR